MNIILGFGSTETEFEKKIEAAITEHVYEQYYSENDNYFTDGFAENIKKWIDSLVKQSQEAAEAYKVATTYPDRYTRFWCSVVHDASHLVFIMTYHHINRRHAMSPDGWGMMQTKPCFCIESWDAGREKRKAKTA